MAFDFYAEVADAVTESYANRKYIASFSESVMSRHPGLRILSDGRLLEEVEVNDEAFQIRISPAQRWDCPPRQSHTEQGVAITVNCLGRDGVITLSFSRNEAVQDFAHVVAETITSLLIQMEA